MKIINNKTKHSNLYKAIAILCLTLIFAACGSSKNGMNTNSGEDLDMFYTKMQSLNFEISNDWAYPLRGNQISLIGNDNYIRFNEEQVDLFLPYFGQRQSGGTYGGDAGMKFEGTAEDFELLKNEEENRLEIRFQVQQNTENLTFNINLYPNNNVRTSVSSSQRDGISYRGTVKQIKEQKDNQ